LEQKAMGVGKDKDSYLKQYPEAKKWLNQCIICQSVGYKPELPEKIHPGYLAENIRRFFLALTVNEISACEQCAQHL
jgi:hypothetical protein